MTEREAPSGLSPRHREALQRAVDLLENQNFAARLADYAGQPVDRVLRMMPKAASKGLNRVIEATILNCLNLAINSIELKAKHPPARRLTSLLAGFNGGVSGFFGFVALPLELPLTTALMLRAIADTARHQGEDLSRLEARLACVEVFALGTRSSSQRRLDVGYYASRALLSKLAGQASTYLAERSTVSASPWVISPSGGSSVSMGLRWCGGSTRTCFRAGSRAEPEPVHSSLISKSHSRRHGRA